MRFPFLFLLLFLGNSSCTSNQPSSDVTSDVHENTATANADSLRLDSLEWVRDCFIKDRFELKLQDGKSRQYYHAYWKGYAGQHTNTLTCLVSENGELMITSSLEPKLCGQNHNRLEVIIGDSVYQTEISDVHDVVVEPGELRSECTVWQGVNAERTATAIAEHAKEIIRVKIYHNETLITSYELGDLARKAFADCVPLNNLMKQIGTYTRKSASAE